MEHSSVRPHVPEEELHAFCDGQLSSPQHNEIAEHLLGCLICRAQHAEVETLRERTASLLAMAVPNGGRRGVAATRAAARRRWPRIATAAAAAMVGLGVWFSLKPEANVNADLAATLGMPRSGVSSTGVTDSAGMRARQLAIVGRTNPAPSVVPLGGAMPDAPGTAIGTAAVDPVFTADWTATDTASARSLGAGSLAHVASVPVASVHVHPSAIGGRPTIIVRQELRDGRPIWVLEGLEDDITPFSQVLQASGFAISMITRTRPDYVGAAPNLRISTRMVTVAGYLPVDSLNALAGKLTLH